MSFTKNDLQLYFGTMNIFTISDVGRIPVARKMTDVAVRRQLSRLYQLGELQKSGNGKYYIAEKGRYFDSYLTKEDKYRTFYINSSTDEIKGIYTGQKLLNKWGLTQQLAYKSEIISNRTKSANYYNPNTRTLLSKPLFEVTSKNYQILELFEILRNIDNIVSEDNMLTIYRKISMYINNNFSEREQVEIIYYLFNYGTNIIKQRFNNLLPNLNFTVQSIFRLYESEV